LVISSLKWQAAVRGGLGALPAGTFAGVPLSTLLLTARRAGRSARQMSCTSGQRDW
jgi:hypothetical protein